MKRILTRLLLVIAIIAFAYPGYTQKVIKVEDRVLKDSIGENATRNTKQLGYLLLLRRMTNNTKEKVEDTEQLQTNYQEFLKQTHSTASLEVASHEDKQDALNLAMHTAGHLDDYSLVRSLQQAYIERAEPLEKSQRLFEQLIPYDATLLFSDLALFTAYQKARSLNIIAFQEMSERRKLQLAKTYQQFAQRKIAQANELRLRLTRNRNFSMTEAERLEMLGQMQEDLLSSKQLKAQADRLIQQADDYPFSKQQVLNSFWQAHERKAISTTPVF